MWVKKLCLIVETPKSGTKKEKKTDKGDTGKKKANQQTATFPLEP